MTNMISIAICTYNRAASLNLTLQSLLPCSAWLQQHAELLIIDNNSSDETHDIVSQYHDHLPIRYIVEQKQGLAVARNRALQVFKHAAIVFFDDDVTLSLACLEAYYQDIQQDQACGFFGGKIDVDWQQQKPTWLKSDDLVLLNGLFGRYDLGISDVVYDAETMLPFGANFVLRKSLIEKVGLFNEALGVSGNNIGRGEETDYFQRAMAVGAQGKYLAQAVVLHRFQLERINSLYLFRYGIAKGQALQFGQNKSEQIGKHRASEHQIKLIHYAMKGLWQLIKCRKDRYYQCVINMGIQYALTRN